MNKQSLKKALIIVHDLVMTALAVLSHVLRPLRRDLLDERLRQAADVPAALRALMPASSYWFFQLYHSKWRFASLPDLSNIVRASTVLALTLLVVDYLLVSPQILRLLLLRQDRHRALLADRRCSCWAARGSLSATSNTPRSRADHAARRHHADAPARARHRRRGGAARDRVRHGQEAAAEGHPLVPRGRSSASRSGACRCSAPSQISSRSCTISSERGVADPPPGRDAERARAGSASRHADRPGAPSRPALCASRASAKACGTPSSRRSRSRTCCCARPCRSTAPGWRVFIRGKRVLVTGGGGSIGSEICARVVAFGASRPAGARELRAVAAPILENARLRQSDTAGRWRHRRRARPRARPRGHARFLPDVVFHAAALKHVPYLEKNWTEGIKTNVFGSVNVADAAVEAGASGDRDDLDRQGHRARLDAGRDQALRRDVLRRRSTRRISP